MGLKARWMRAHALAVVGLSLTLQACQQQPAVGARSTPVGPSEGPRIVIENARLDLFDHVVATFSVTQDGAPLGLSDVTTLGPRFTLATLSKHPVDGLLEWKSQLLTGSQTAAALPPSGPGTPPSLVIVKAKQPGSETPASFVDLGDGRYEYVFANALTAYDPAETVRVGVYLRGAASPSLRTADTYDFRPDHGAVVEHELVTDDACNGCHGNLVAHGSRTRVRLCLTCHTWQAADPDTVDPAAIISTTPQDPSYLATSNPNPLELARMVHRIHRGTELPTLFQSSSSANPAPDLTASHGSPWTPDVDTTTILARRPFSPANNTTAILGAKYSIVGHSSSELVGGRVVQRTDNGQPAKTVVAGITFPRDLRDCGACHTGRQASLKDQAISRRTCSGCHPDAWYQATPATLDASHFAHVGGPRSDDTECANCHVRLPDPALNPGWKLYAPIAEIHVPLDEGIRTGALTISIVKVQNLRPGARPQVTYRIRDPYGPIAPSPSKASPGLDPSSSTTASFVARQFAPLPGRSNSGSLTIRIVGPTAADYVGALSLASGSSQPSGDPVNLSTSSFTDEYVYTFSTLSPAAKEGTYAVGMEGRRREGYAHYDPGTDSFRWPYTGEQVTETAENPIVYVDTATGAWPPDGTAPRRRIVAQENCVRCHRRVEAHGGSRNQVEYCLFCHTPTATDYSRRTKTSAGFVDLNASFDGIEERTIHFKVMIHRIHTGERTGAASLEGIAPFAVYGYSGAVFFEGLFPNDLRNCTACHSGKTYLVEAVPADAPPTVANETASIRHAANSSAHASGEPAALPIQAACTGCHASGATFAHAAANTANGVEGCAKCHGAKGAKSTDVVHGLLPPTGAAANASFSSIVQNILVPRCASTACHAAGATPPALEASSAYAALVNAPSAQSALFQVEPNAPQRSYLVYKLRGDAASAGGSVATIMPPDGALAPADIAAIEAWIANGAPND
jgi:OmcA/MtrC family decaheme c-type cytochrome